MGAKDKPIGQGNSKPVTSDMLSHVRFLQNIKENPSKTAFAYTLANVDMGKNDYRHILYVNDGKNRKILNMKDSGTFVWETDDTLLVSFEQTKKDAKLKKEKRTVYARHTLSEKTLEDAYVFDFPATIHTVLDDHTLLLQASLSPEEHVLYKGSEEERKAYLEKVEDGKDVIDIRSIPYQFNGKGFLLERNNQLLTFDTETGKTKPLFGPGFSVQTFAVSDDKKTIVVAGSESDGIRKPQAKLYVHDRTTGTTDVLYDHLDHAIRQIVLFKDKVVVAATDMAEYGMNQNADFFEVRSKTLVPFRTFSGSLGSSVGTDVRLGSGPFSAMLGGVWHFVETRCGHTVLNALHEDGNLERVLSFKGSIDGIVAVGDMLVGPVLYGQKLQELHIIDPVKGTTKPLTRFNNKVLEGCHVAKPQPIKADLGTHTVDGWVLYPKDYDSNNMYPAILDIHGGPKTVYGKVFVHEMQVWASKGYFVMYCNPRGSDGKGNAFADIRGKYGTIDYEDIMAFVQRVQKKINTIDRDRLYVTGGSYGGFMTNWIVGHTPMFKAAVTQRSISNWLSFYGTSDIGYTFAKDQAGGDPVETTQDLWRQSPLAYARNVMTPLLFIHSDEDYRCPVEQAMQMYTVLKERGLDTRLLWFKGETHELSRSGKPKARLRRLDAITAWFETHR